MNLEAIALIDLIETRGSFAAAAIALNKAPSAITYQIRQLEESLDMLIYDRSGHKAQLTPAGRILLDQGRLLLQQTETLKQQVKAAANGWEPEFRIVLDDMIPFSTIIPWIQAFDDNCAFTILRIRREVLSGTWETLHTGQSDLLIGTHLDQNQFASSAALSIRPLGQSHMVFAIAPNHPLAKEPEPLQNHTLMQHRAIAAGDTSRQFKPLTFGVQQGQHVLTVPSLQDKLQAHLSGLGAGWLPAHLANPFIQTGKLVTRQTEEQSRYTPLCFAWKQQKPGNALNWWIQFLSTVTLNLT